MHLVRRSGFCAYDWDTLPLVKEKNGRQKGTKMCDAVGIYLLNLFLAFLTPKIDPSLEMDTQENELEEGPSLPTKADEEFKPFIRRLPEFKFWYVRMMQSREREKRNTKLALLLLALK